MGRITLITGGARSGKSSLALRLAGLSGKKKVFMATCVPADTEMKDRVRAHKRSRPKEWKNIEAGTSLESHLKKESGKKAVIVIDCLTLYVSALLVGGESGKTIKAKIRSILDILKRGIADALIVTNEVGSGIVPDNVLARVFRDIAGFANQSAAAAADEVFLTVCGIPVLIKGEKSNGQA